MLHWQSLTNPPIAMLPQQMHGFHHTLPDHGGLEASLDRISIPVRLYGSLLMLGDPVISSVFLPVFVTSDRRTGMADSAASLVGFTSTNVSNCGNQKSGM